MTSNFNLRIFVGKLLKIICDIRIAAAMSGKNNNNLVLAKKIIAVYILPIAGLQRDAHARLLPVPALI
jgi:hypothetical protein